LENGDLMRAADEAGFALMVTCDQNIRYQRNMRMRPIGLVVLSTNHWPTLRTGAGLILDAVNHLKRNGYTYVEAVYHPGASRTSSKPRPAQRSPPPQQIPLPPISLAHLQSVTLTSPA
jgi:hypothetical protein